MAALLQITSLCMASLYRIYRKVIWRHAPCGIMKARPCAVGRVATRKEARSHSRSGGMLAPAASTVYTRGVCPQPRAQTHATSAEITERGQKAPSFKRGMNGTLQFDSFPSTMLSFVEQTRCTTRRRPASPHKHHFQSQDWRLWSQQACHRSVWLCRWMGRLRRPWGGMPP